jgi:hypothetical protein
MFHKLIAHDVALNVDLQGDEIIVTLPGTRLRMTYQKSPKGGPWLIETSNYVSDAEAPITPQAFIDVAFRAATDKARKLGWKV